MKEYKGEYKPAKQIELDSLSLEETKKYQKVVCPSCQATVRAEDIELQSKMGKCGSCNIIFSIADDIKSLKHEKELRQEFLRPEGIELFFFKDELDITIIDHMGVGEQVLQFFHFLTIFALGIYFFGEHSLNPIILLIFITISLYLIYRAASYTRKHKTFIEVNSEELNIKSRPSNYFTKDKHYVASDIDQIYLKSDPNGSGQISIHAIINNPDGQKHEKLCLASNISKAKYLEQEIENYLNIKDRKVPESNV